MGKFVVRETKTGTKFDLKASNGQVIGKIGRASCRVRL